jgi:glycine dehydrogenase subunit 1
MSYISNTDADRRKMFRKIGVNSFEEIFDDIPEHLRLRRPLDIPRLSEMEVLAEIDGLAHANHEETICFAGGGVYDHFVPSAVGAIVSRPEFMTAYTPYQAEVAQGTLQVIYEFQTHICRLTGMEVANASMYDGASAAAEAVLLCTALTRRNKVLVCETVSPLVREVVATYAVPRDIEIVTVPMRNGATDPDRLATLIDDRTACLLVAQPNFFGGLEEAVAMGEAVHKVGAKLIMSVDPIAQALLKTPGEIGADIAVGEGQPLGISLSFGGPLLGFFAARKTLARNLPGRIAARTTDVEGRTGFVLTLQTREQHIRRQKATSNICTNQALCATTATVYLSLMGRTGLKQVALLSAEKAQAAAERIGAIDGFDLYYPTPFVREFMVKTPRPASEIVQAMIRRGILPGVDAGRWYPELKHGLIVALTEKRTEAQIAKLVSGLEELSTSGVLSGLQN